MTGYAPPLEKIGEICAARGIKLVVDGAQALGHKRIDFDEIGIDLLTGAGHKGLHGVMGTGFLIFGRKTLVTPVLYGGTGTESDNLSQPIAPPEGLEAGTLNLPGIAALNAALRWTEEHREDINSKIAEISLRIHSGLQELDLPIYSIPGSPILSFALPNTDSATVANVLDAEFGIAVRSGLHCAPLIHKTFGTEKKGLVRVGIGYGNTMREAMSFLRAIRTIRDRATR